MFMGTCFHWPLCLQGHFYSFVLFVIFSVGDGVKLDLARYPWLRCDGHDNTKQCFKMEENCRMERNATGELENPFISLAEINGGSGAAEQLIYFTIYYQLNVQFNIIKWELVRTFYFFPVCTFLPP